MSHVNVGHPSSKARADDACRVARSVCALVLLCSTSLNAQRSTTPDTVRSDSSRIQPLATVTVRVMADQRTVERVPWAVGVVGTRELRRAQPTVNLDEALSSVPGVFVASRYNLATDSRIAVRGAGARANFGLRGVKVLLDGVPQTLPDGQSQLTNVDLGNLERVEVLRGSAASLYGNGSAGVLSFVSDVAAASPFQQSVRVLAGSFGERKVQLRASGRAGRAIVAASMSRLTIDGFRQRSDAESRQFTLAMNYALGADDRLEVRVQAAEVPNARNPGALTFGEYALNRDSASANNVRRGADRRVRQDQLSVAWHRGSSASMFEAVTTAWLGTRGVRNALATPPPGTVTPASGLYSVLDRGFSGLRSSVRVRGSAATTPTLTAGMELQRMRDRRVNLRATGGRPTLPTDTLLLDQIETVWSAAPFAQVEWTPSSRVLVSTGMRYDRLRFGVEDLFTLDGGINGGDNSGARILSAASGHVGITMTGWSAIAPYANVSTSFETPTTTELQANPERQGGFNPSLGPQRTVSVEVGARGSLAGQSRWNIALYRALVSNAIVQARFVDGTGFFENAGRTENMGLEAGVSTGLASLGALNATYTWSSLKFADYRQRSGAAVDTLDGNQLPGVPPHQLRLGFRSASVRGLTLDADQTWTSALFADDLNTIRVPGWGSGVTNLRAAWTTRWRRTRIEPFAGVLNLRNTAYVGAVTVNGAFGRVLEPAPLRNWYIGLDLGAAR